jgi:hypothetical protein
MGVAGWRFAHMVAAGSMIMIGIMLYSDWPQ